LVDAERVPQEGREKLEIVKRIREGGHAAGKGSRAERSHQTVASELLGSLWASLVVSAGIVDGDELGSARAGTGLPTKKQGFLGDIG
jgi:hypothetical protein